LVKPITLLSGALVPYVLKKKILRKEDWRPEFRESEEIVWLLYYQMTVLFATVGYPPTVLL